MGDVIEPLMKLGVPLLKELATTGVSSVTSMAKSSFSTPVGDTESDPVAELVKNKEKSRA